MGIVGNARDALTIRDYTIALSKWQYGGWDPSREAVAPVTPEGWKLLGSGCYRQGWLSPDGVVYKVEHAYDLDSDQTNKGEAANGVRILTRCKLPNFVRLPKFTFYELDGRGVMACEYVKRTNPEPVVPWQAVRYDVQRAITVGDLHHGNVCANGGKWVITDFGD